jgi:tetratricopeptide (TPR) repeat protein
LQLLLQSSREIPGIEQSRFSGGAAVTGQRGLIPKSPCAQAGPVGDDRPFGRLDPDRLVEPNPLSPEACNNRGAARHARGDLDGAIADFDRALELNPRYPEAYNNRGAARHARGDLDGAIADLDRALELKSNYAEAYNNRGAARGARGDRSGAIADFDRAVQLTSRHAAAPIYHNRGAARSGDFDGAIADFNQAITIDPLYCVAYISRGNARYHQRDPGCQADYRMAFLLDARLAAREIIRVIAVGVRCDLESVLDGCRSHLRLNASDVVARARRGLTLLLLGREAEAEPDFRQIRLQSPEWEHPLQLLVQEAKRPLTEVSAVAMVRD